MDRMFQRDCRNARVRLPLMGDIAVNPEGALGRRLVARHDDLSYQAMLKRRQAKWEAAGRPIR